MAPLLIRDLEPEVVEQLKLRAKRNGRSLQAEVKRILESAVPRRAVNIEEIRAHMAETRAATSGRVQTDSADLVREDRDR